MNAGLLKKAFDELKWPTLVLGFFLALAEGLLTYALATHQATLAGHVAELPFFQSILKGLLGVETAGVMTSGALVALGWVHPVVLALLWAHAIIAATRVPAGEIDHGTADVLLALPVSRRDVFLSESLAISAAATLMIAAAAIGHLVGARFLEPGLRIPASTSAVILTNLLALDLAVAAIAALMSALSDRRGRAISASFLVVLASFLLNYLAQVWAPMERLNFLSLLQYHRPLRVMQNGAWPVRDIAVLCAVGLLFWLLAGWVFSRRDIATT